MLWQMLVAMDGNISVMNNCLFASILRVPDFKSFPRVSALGGVGVALDLREHQLDLTTGGMFCCSMSAPGGGQVDGSLLALRCDFRVSCFLLERHPRNREIVRALEFKSVVRIFPLRGADLFWPSVSTSST